MFSIIIILPKLETTTKNFFKKSEHQLQNIIIKYGNDSNRADVSCVKNALQNIHL